MEPSPPPLKYLRFGIVYLLNPIFPALSSTAYALCGNSKTLPLLQFVITEHRQISRTRMRKRKISPAKTRDQQMTNVVTNLFESVHANSDHRIYHSIPFSPLQTTTAGFTETF